MIPKEEYNLLKKSSIQYNDSIGRDVNGGQVNHIELGEGGRVVIKPTDITASTKNNTSSSLGNYHIIPNEAFQNWPKKPPYKTHDGPHDSSPEENLNENNNPPEPNLNVLEENDISPEENVNKSNMSNREETEVKTLHTLEDKTKNDVMHLPSSQIDQTENPKKDEPNNLNASSSETSSEIRQLNNQSPKIDETANNIPTVITGDDPSSSAQPFIRNNSSVRGIKDQKKRRLQKNDRPMKSIPPKHKTLTIAEDIFRRQQTLPDEDIPQQSILSEEEEIYRRQQTLPDDDDSNMQTLPDDDSNMLDMSEDQKTKLNELREARLNKILYDNEGQPNIYRKYKSTNIKKLSQSLKKKKGRQIGKDDIMMLNTPRPTQKVKVTVPKEKEQIEDILRKPNSVKIQKKKQNKSIKQIKTANIPNKKKIIKSMIDEKLAQLNSSKPQRKKHTAKSKSALEQIKKVIQQKTTRKRRQESLSSTDTNYIPPKISVVRKKQRKE